LSRQAADKVWAGQTIVCIASGPSLTQEDCSLVEQSGLITIAVNSSWKLARFASVIYAADYRWWENYRGEIDIDAELWTWSERAAKVFGLNQHHMLSGAENSGLRAMDFAIQRGASRIILLGYDCSVRNGTHWHGDHTKTNNPDASRCKAWQNQFARLGLHGCEVVNCSRFTALKCFPKNSLEAELC
jgi:hypothetical protein